MPRRLLLVEDSPMMRRMTERYEVTLISVFLGRSLDRFMRRRIGPVLGARVAEIVSEVLERRQRLLGEALDSMRLHYTLYSGALESRILSIASLRLENEEFDDLAAENLIGEELHSELIRSVERRRRRLSRPLRFDLQTGIDQRIKSGIAPRRPPASPPAPAARWAHRHRVLRPGQRWGGCRRWRRARRCW